MSITFPENFVWGASTAAHQIEGNNVNSDWWAREVDPASTLAEPSGETLHVVIGRGFGQGEREEPGDVHRGVVGLQHQPVEVEGRDALGHVSFLGGIERCRSGSPSGGSPRGSEVRVGGQT